MAPARVDHNRVNVGCDVPCEFGPDHCVRNNDKEMKIPIWRVQDRENVLPELGTHQPECRAATPVFRCEIRILLGQLR